ncbi:hypothetical protein DCAR_0310570 [Daucus carota subsp. sativus]|uniref:SAM domain-containing protein n=1 Tax=Daucus carota subsp. sativus TaxID=79200 RepID=A0A162AG29_DAUCS|nr:PREDICTED: uncharacterized protein LOC108211256 [Daucus carota subsp. sativus]WOG91322.1 hypothetical protein DCAR_0310570 [Daucus carota subsp. sativus]
MDWYSWLSETALDPLHTYKYGRLFTNNQLRAEDVIRFDHDFLQSLGISVAKHRLEILKLRDKKVEKDSRKLSIALAIRKTKSLLGKYWTRPRMALLEQLKPWTSQWRKKDARVYDNKRRIMKSGPMERTNGDTCVLKNKSGSKSGPVDWKVQERLMSSSWNSPSPVCVPSPVRDTKTFNESGVGGKWSMSPRFESDQYKNKDTVSHNELHSIWSLMFEDIKPT